MRLQTKYQPVTHLRFLPYSVRAGHCLQVVLWIPIWVEDDYCVCCRQVYSKTASSCGKKEAKVWRVLGIEMVQGLPSLLTTNAPIQPLYESTISNEFAYVYKALNSNYFMEYTWKGQALKLKYCAKRSRTITIWEKSSTRWPVSFNLVRSLSKRMNLPLCLTRFYVKELNEQKMDSIQVWTSRSFFKLQKVYGSRKKGIKTNWGD